MVVRSPGTTASLSQAHLWVVEAGAEHNRLPVGMLLGLSRFPFPTPVAASVEPMLLHGRHARTVFAWQLAAAPGETLVAADIAPNIQLGRVLLDTVIQVSLASGHFGYVLLHADPMGGEELLGFYTASGMACLPQDDYPMVSSQRDNDGRYFFMVPGVAGAFAKRYAHLRASALGVGARDNALFPA